MAARIARLLALAFFLACNCLPLGEAAAIAPQPASAAELISAVNHLRLVNGLAPLSEHPVLMQVAQGQSDALLATEGQVGHSRPNGMTFTQQLLLLGYPLSGDLSLGGYRSENFIFGYQLTPNNAVEAWQGDEPHTNTMLSPNRSDIGAGVSTASDGTVYYVIDTALRTASGQPQSDADLYLPGGPGAAPDPGLAVNQYIVPIAVSTARPDGNVFHTVQYGQTLWGIAIEYGTKIDQIRALNHLGGTMVYPNQLLLVRQGATQPPPPPTILPMIVSVEPASVAGAEVQAFARVSTPTAAPAAQPEAVKTTTRGPSLSVWIAMIVLLLLIGGVSAAWFIRDPGQ